MITENWTGAEVVETMLLRMSSERTINCTFVVSADPGKPGLWAVKRV